MRAFRILIPAAFCLALVAGCGGGPDPLPLWPKLSTGIEPDANVQPPAWYKSTDVPAAWPLGTEPAFGTAEWRQWVQLRYNRTGVIRQASAPPKIDGNLDDEAWKGAEFKAPFVDAAGKPVELSTTVSLTYDNENLYIAAHLFEPHPENLRADAKEHDKTSTTDDRLDVYLAPNWPLGRTVFAVTINSKGLTAEAADGNPAWNPKLSVATGTDPAGWTLEAAIPLESFGVKGADLWGRIWTCQVQRYSSTATAPVVSFWNPTHNRGSALGHIIFKGVKPPEPAKPPEKETKPAAPPKEAKPAADTKPPAGKSEETKPATPKEAPPAPEPKPNDK